MNEGTLKLENVQHSCLLLSHYTAHNIQAVLCIETGTPDFLGGCVCVILGLGREHS